MKDNYKSIINRIIDIRKGSGLTQEAFYQTIMSDKNLTGSYCQSRQSRIEKGSIPTINELLAVASFKKITLDELVTGNPNTANKPISYRDLCKAIYMIDKKHDITFDSSVKTEVFGINETDEAGNSKPFEIKIKVASVLFYNETDLFHTVENRPIDELRDIDNFIDNYKRIKDARIDVSASVYDGMVQSLLDKVPDKPIPEVDISDDSKKK